MSDDVVYPVDETKQPVVPDYDNRPSTSLYTLDEVQEYEAELRRAQTEGREPTLTDPRLRTHNTEILMEQLELVPPIVDTGIDGGKALTPGVSNVDQGVVSPGTDALPVGFKGPQDTAVTEEEEQPLPDDEEPSEQ